MAVPTDRAVELSAMEQRVLGSLLEKQRTVPAAYPLTFAGLRTACNQASSRDPVVDYDQHDIEACVRELRRRDLVRIINTPGQRALKVHQRLGEQLALADDERALMTVLLLRGPQSAGELKTRTERLYPFTDRDEVQTCLARLAERTTPLVVELPRQAGRHDPRWLHLLGPVAAASTELPAPGEPPDRESVLADGTASRDERFARAYDLIARDPDSDANPGPLDDFDAWLLAAVAAGVGDAPIMDVGCGTGRVTGYLAAAGADATGLDAAPAMVDRARAEHPGLRFETGDLRTLMRPPAAAGWGAVTAWDCLDHFAPSELPAVIAGQARVLMPGGAFAAAVPIGSMVGRAVTASGEELQLPLVQHDRGEVLTAIGAGGLVVDRWYLVGTAQPPGPVGERLLVLAHRPR